MNTIEVKLPEKLYEYVKLFSQERGLLIEDYLIEVIIDNLEVNENDKLITYVELCRKYLSEGENLLKQKNYVQACEKIWGFASIVVKIIAFKKFKQILKKHKQLWSFVNYLSKEVGDEILKWFAVANELHTNFYENELPDELIEKYIHYVISYGKELLKKYQIQDIND